MDYFEKMATGLESPGEIHYEITPNDSTDLPRIPRAIRIQTDGIIVVRDKFGTDIPYPVTAGEVFAFRGVRILATGTTADVVGWE